MQIGICGKTNTGKSTFFSAATLIDAEISNRVFTTIKPNQGVGYVTTPCPCKGLGVKCEPKNSRCVDGVRYIPVKLIDIAGLVPGAHEGRGLGNQFLSDIMEASALIHVVDISGSTDAEGNPTEPGANDPMNDIRFLEEEIDYWILGILKKNWKGLVTKATAGVSKLEELIHNQLSGLGVGVEEVSSALNKVGVGLDSDDEKMLKFVRVLREHSKPMVIAANKIDVPGAKRLLEEVKKKVKDTIPCSAESELALRRAAEKGLIRYSPGDKDFEVLKDIDEKQLQALNFIGKNVLEGFGSTGVQQTLNYAAFNLLNMIVVYPVENENRYSSGKGNVLPDAYLVPKGTTAKELAGRIHTDFLNRFVSAIDARKKQRIAADHELKDGDIVKIALKK
jgi:ribosome-binding ATPase YchF (GTP1/OBG family)